MNKREKVVATITAQQTVHTLSKTIATMVGTLIGLAPPDIALDTSKAMELFKTRMIARVPELLERVADLHEATYNDEEVDALYNFYTSPIGASIVEKGNAIAEPAQRVGNAWGQEIMMGVLEELGLK